MANSPWPAECDNGRALAVAIVTWMRRGHARPWPRNVGAFESWRRGHGLFWPWPFPLVGGHSRVAVAIPHGHGRGGPLMIDVGAADLSATTAPMSRPPCADGVRGGGHVGLTRAPAPLHRPHSRPTKPTSQPLSRWKGRWLAALI
jgi:hypothetical protein